MYMTSYMHCVIGPLVQASVEVILILRNEEEVSAAYSGDNIRVKLKGVEEEVWSTGVHVQYIYIYIYIY